MYVHISRLVYLTIRDHLRCLSRLANLEAAKERTKDKRVVELYSCFWTSCLFIS